MKRRDVLAGTAAALPALAGCLTAVTGPERTTPTDRNVSDGSTDLVFGDLAALSVIHHAGYDPGANLAAVRVSVWHREGSHLDAVTLRLGVPADGVRHVDAYLETPGHESFPAVRYYQTEGDAVFEVTDLGPHGRGTVALDFLLRPFGTEMPVPGGLPVAVDAALELTRRGVLGGRVEATGEVAVEVAQNTWQAHY